MNRKQLALLLVVLVVLGGTGYFLLNRNQESWSSSGSKLGQKLLPNFQVNDVSDLHIKGDGELNLVKKGDRWDVAERADYPADFSKIKELLVKLSDLKIVQAEPIGPSQLDRMHLGQPGSGPDSSTLIELKNAQDKVIDSVLLGKKHTQKSERPTPMQEGDDQYPDGRYVMLNSDPGEVLTVTDPLNNVNPAPGEWLDKDFFKVEKPKSISFTSTNAADSWILTRATETAPWVMADLKKGEILDSNKVSSLSSTLSYPSFIDVATNQNPAATGLDKPLLLTIETFDHFTYDLRIGDKTPENNYDLRVAVTAVLPQPTTSTNKEAAKLKPLEDKLKQEQSLDKWTYVVNSYLIDPMIRPRGQLMADNKPARKKNDSGVPELGPGEHLDLTPTNTVSDPADK